MIPLTALGIFEKRKFYYYHYPENDEFRISFDWGFTDVAGKYRYYSDEKIWYYDD